MASEAPSPSVAALPELPSTDFNAQYIGKSLKQLPTPAAVIDRAIATRNCQLMLDACAGPGGSKSTGKGLNVSFRAHVKSHKVSLLILQLSLCSCL